jgi:general nucleoside transport system ATP-binding protein
MKVDLNYIHKHFGQIHANDNITLSIPSGTIQGILGENGAGKSTLMKVLSGFIQADSGEIVLDNNIVKIHTPSDAIKHGIGMLHQDPLDFPPMRVIDNLIIGHAGGFLPHRRNARRALMDLQGQFGFQIDPDVYVDTLTVGERQQLEIIRLLWLGAKVLILDEPTTGISALQKEKLFVTLRLLAERGMTIIFVSHKLEEINVLCSRVAVFCRGKLVGEATPPYDMDALVTMMFGKVISLESRHSTGQDTPVLELQQLEIEDYRLRIKNLDMNANKGEVIGLAGMEGSGQRQFLLTCAGLIRPVAGRISLLGNDLTGKPYHEFQRHGISYMPASRMEEGLIPGLTLTEHFILAEEQKGFLIHREKSEAIAKQRIMDYSIRGNPGTKVEALSGGNQQRALLALLRTPLVLLLMEHPTRGLDIESSIYIWSRLKERCQQGTTIIFISSDLEEILQYSDRILVFFGGKASIPMDANTTTVDQLGMLIGGKDLV